MAVTITGNPDPITPSDNPVVWVFSSDQYTQANFAFLCEIYINGSLHSRHYPIFPEINNNVAHFDASVDGITKIACSTPPLNTNDFSFSASNYALIKIVVKEVYGTTPTEQASAESEVYVFKSCLHDEDFVKWLSADYLWTFSLMDTTKPKFMTHSPRGKVNCKYEEYFYLMFMNGEADLDVIINLYDSSNTLIVSDALSTVSSGSLITMINVCPEIIVANSLITKNNFDNCKYYEIILTDYEPEQESEAFRIYLNRLCDRFETKRIHFLQSLGGIDAFSFDMPNTTEREVTHYTYQKQWGGFDPNGNYVFNVNQGREIDFRTSSIGKLVVATDFLGESVHNWLVNELFESPYVFIENPVDDEMFFKRVRSMATKITYVKRVKDEMPQVTMELGLSDNRMSALI